MAMLKIVIYGILLYIFLVFFASRFTVRHLGFAKSRLPERLPKAMEEKIKELKKKSKNKKEFFLKSYDFLAKRYQGAKGKTYPCFHMLYYGVEKVWSQKGFQHCTQQNFMLRVFLVKSGFFKDEEIRLRHTVYIINIHQYMQVFLDGKWVDIDLWANFLGIKIAEHAGL